MGMEILPTDEELINIINDDCLNVLKNIPDNSVDLVLTDPPYNTGMQEVSGKAWLCHFFNDNYTDEDYQNLIFNSCKEFFRILKNDRGGAIFINWKKMQMWIDNLEKVGFNVKNVIVWDKVVHGLNWQNYAYTYELIIYFTKGNYFPNNKSTEDNKNGYYKDVWHIKRDMGKADNIEQHETVKQINVVRLLIKHLSKEGDIVLDCFAGSGTTGVACKQLKRNYILIEKEPKYIEIIKKRLSQNIL
jgi:site-specific DNA-methyltransferase (adenine-specific)